jgi:PIN domain nuclease of toxin-antitoxin system
MKLLLDTHALLWALISPDQLSKKAVRAIESPDNEIYVSTLSLWEIAIKFNLGKIALKGITPADLPDEIERTGFQLLAPTANEYASFYQLPRHVHKDPFDRMLIWQSLQQSLTLVTMDGDIGAYQSLGLQTLW